jgi:hypothetical protein
MPNDYDHCGRCGCERRFHNPPASYSYAKTGASSGRAHQIKILARTCCDNCPHCFCFCTAWVEPYEGQPYVRCVYETEDHNHFTPPIQDSSTISRLVPSMPKGIPDNRSDTGPHKNRTLKSGNIKPVTFKTGKIKKEKPPSPRSLF